MHILSTPALLLLGGVTSVLAQAWTVELYGDQQCTQYLLEWTWPDSPWIFSYDYGVYCAKVTSGPAGGFCTFFSDTGCSQDIGNDDRASVGGQVVGYPVSDLQLKCWSCTIDGE